MSGAISCRLMIGGVCAKRDLQGSEEETNFEVDDQHPIDNPIAVVAGLAPLDYDLAFVPTHCFQDIVRGAMRHYRDLIPRF
ncbi:hypothetical protein BGW38_003358 [Lunasporangiospora selenospora]|uniref:Uncharacterized protein n=1 Tax=Lunasporangiospora selenospora TaxID=979761 RepID=A0A9P6G0G0_9FUNG|nr:hypothetical protein BGW38_003358 [Lunasporangiospora selenospora]